MTKKKSLLDKELQTIKSDFSIKKLSMDSELDWKADLLVKTILPRSYHDYSVRMVFDETPYDNRIAGYEQQIKDIKADNTLFKKLDGEEIRELKNDIKRVQNEKKEMAGNCPTIEFEGAITQLKYIGDNTMLTIRVPDEMIEHLNKRKHYFHQYTLELRPQEIK